MLPDVKVAPKLIVTVDVPAPDVMVAPVGAVHT